jgi:hypothetical protein
MVLDWFFRDSSQGNKNLTPEESQRILDKFGKLSSRILTIPEPIEVLTLDDAIRYFESDCPQSQNVSKGALIRQPHHKGQLLAQLFLDKNNQLILRDDGTPYGRQLVAKRFDKNLRDAFGDKELILVEQKAHRKQFGELIISQFEEVLRDILRLPEVIPILTYESAIQYFVADRPTNSRVKKGAILHQSHPQGHQIVQVFLDTQNNLVLRADGKPYGRQLVARELDEELRDTFGDKDLIIVE